MLSSLDFYYFSPTGGTKKAAGILADTLSGTVVPHDLGRKAALTPGEAEVALIAAPVYGGRVPALVSEQVQQLAGAGKKAITLVVYGNRAYEDALLELNDAAAAAGFHVVASGAFVAEHSFHRAVAAGRPDAQDTAELQAFAEAILAKLDREGELAPVSVPGNRPYKAAMSMPVTPIFLPNCGGCGLCMRLCPTGAISRADGALVTDAAQCILCLACVVGCPRSARILPPPLQATMEQKLSALIGIRRENETYL